MKRPYQLTELQAAFWLGCATALVQTYLAAHYIPYNALPDETAESLATQLFRGCGQVAASCATGATWLALGLAKRLICQSKCWKWRWCLPPLTTYSWGLVFSALFVARVNSEQSTLAPLLAAIHPSLKTDFVVAVVLKGQAASAWLFLALQYTFLALMGAFYRPLITADKENCK